MLRLHRHQLSLMVVLVLVFLQYGSRSNAMQLSSARAEEAMIGAFSDACPCRIPCTCWRTSKANVERCFNVHVYSVKPGPNAGSKARNSTFVFIGIPTRPYEAPAPYKLFVDESAPAKVVGQMSAFFYNNYGISSTVIERVPIQANVSQNSHSVIIPGVLTYKVSPSDKSLAPEVRDFLYPWLHRPQQWEVRQVRYTSGSDNTDYSGTNSVSAEFRIPTVTTDHKDELSILQPNCIHP
jgi:hypothetical protein